MAQHRIAQRQCRILFVNSVYLCSKFLNRSFCNNKATIFCRYKRFSQLSLIYCRKCPIKRMEEPFLKILTTVVGFLQTVIYILLVLQIFLNVLDWIKTDVLQSDVFSIYGRWTTVSVHSNIWGSNAILYFNHEGGGIKIRNTFHKAAFGPRNSSIGTPN